MPVEWVTAPEEPLLGQLEAAVRSRAGAMLVGPAGVGKTSLARAAVANLAGEFGRVATVTGTVAGSAVPFAAFGDLIEISVTDQGIGLSEKDRERVFERFYRVDPARSRATGGTGLGLAIVKHVATNHGGTVSVWSVEGAGSTFTIRLPLVNQPARSSGENAPALAKGSA